MFTKDFSIFTKMVKLAKDQELQYKILYSYHQKNVSNGLTEVYDFLLCTNLFNVYCEERLDPDNTNATKDFIKYNNDSCIEVNFEINNKDKNSIELKSFR